VNVNPVRLRLAEVEWKRLAKIVGLPDAARSDLESILGDGKFLVELQPKLTQPNLTKGALANPYGYGSSAEVLMALMGDPTTRSLAAFFSLDEHIKHVASLAKWLAVAERRLPAGKRGDKNYGAYIVTGGIDVLLKRFRGEDRGLARDKKDDPGEEFLEACLKMIGAKVTAAGMIERLVRERGKVSPENS
jgi:hypothetical protein